MRTLLVSFVLVCGCGGVPGTRVRMDLSSDTTVAGHFFDIPYPSDLRLDAEHHPRLSGWPNPDELPLIQGLIDSVASRTYWPVLAVAYFDFDAPLGARALKDSVPADVTAPVLLVDLSDAPPSRGRLTPVWLQSGLTDVYLPATTLAVAARPGFVLSPRRTYAVVVKRSLDDGQGHALGVAPEMATLARGGTPKGTSGATAKALYAPLWPVLKELGVAADDVAAATIFTTADAVAETRALTDAALAAHKVTIDDLALHAGDGDHDRYCELSGTVTFPQFQRGMPPFNTDGLLVLDDKGAPVRQRDEVAEVVITIPKMPMPDAGYPFVLYLHGSGGDAYEVTNAGPEGPNGDESIGKGLGPAYVMSPEGFAMAATSLPISPSRVPGATDYAYVNPQNLAATRDIFRQGVIEQRLFAAALEALVIPPSALGTCAGATLPPGAPGYRVDASKMFAQGHSMGGMYANLVSAVEPKIRATVPTGAGGDWQYFILETSFVPNAPQLLSVFFHIDATSFVHPILTLFEAATEPSDPLVSTPRLAHEPLPGSPVRSVYEPVGKDDPYFPTEVYDTMALGYDHEEAGQVEWQSMQDALALDARAGILAYPVRDNRTSVDGTPFTGAVAQYLGDGIASSHQIYRQLDAVKYQYRCFFASALAGTPTIYAPASIDTPCP